MATAPFFVQAAPHVGAKIAHLFYIQYIYTSVAASERAH